MHSVRVSSQLLVSMHCPLINALLNCTCGPQVNVTGDAMMGTVTGLSPFTVYSCTIFAVTVADGPESEPVVVRTAEAGKGVFSIVIYTIVISDV